MSPPLSDTLKHLSTCPLVVVAITVIAGLLPLSASALPIAPPEPTPSSGTPSSNPSHQVRFDLIFFLVLYFLVIGTLILVASSETFSIDRMCTAFNTLKQYLSLFRLTTFFAGAGNAIAGVNDIILSSTRNGSGEVRSVPSVGRTIPGHDPDPDRTRSTASV